MGSLALTSPPGVKVPSYLASSSSSLFSRSSISNSAVSSLVSSWNSIIHTHYKCNLPKALNLGNGTTLPKYFDSSSRLEKPFE
ncbi:unnamed protein product [Brassica napus]|uniref:(rape) hypothetical protein n=1 Tax=Brassica napus TaxID=3708 RepID=A0A816TFW5_BRANA|nr:unnamed protein product [Brassica napus]